MVGQTSVVAPGPVPQTPASPASPLSPLSALSPQSPHAPQSPTVLLASSEEPAEKAGLVSHVAENAGKRRAGMYIMPDGRPLAAYLANANVGESAAPKRMGPKGKKNQRKKKGSATFGSRRSAPPPSLFASQLDEEELNSLNKLGQRKQRRWTNDLLLRAMAPALSPGDIDGLFKPVPFGDVHPPSAFSMVEEDSGMQELWRRCLLSVGMDKQDRILEKWREYVNDLNRTEVDDGAERDGDDAEEQEGERHARNVRRATITAYRKRWQGSVSSSGRAAVKNVSEEVVREIEAQMFPCLFGDVEEVKLYPEDGYGRLLGHSLAKFHGLSSNTKRDEKGGKYIVVRRCSCSKTSEDMYIALSDWLLGCCQ